KPPARPGHGARPRLDAPLDGDQGLPPRAECTAVLARGQLQREQQPCRDRQGALYAECRRLPDAHQEGSGGAGLEIFQANAAVIFSSRTRFATCIGGAPSRRIHLSFAAWDGPAGMWAVLCIPYKIVFPLKAPAIFR